MTVYVIDDHPLMRDALTMLVQRVRPGLKVVSVHKLSSLESTVERQGEPELFCLDLKLPDTLGLSGVHAVKAKFPQVPLVIVTGSEASECEAACLEAGANLFLEKASPPNTIIEGLRTFLPTPEEAEAATANAAAPTKLSKRQKQLILMLDQGLSNRDIADKLAISEHTVKVHFWRLFRRLGVNSRTQALHFARTNGWLGI
ncbi:MAG: DNA-binding response regulator [Betaproteobacteria bacterium]|jgi:DNA-binding NarL/FixJ family response regulator|nr:DNA-binding response regulator [Betaproteobacteria bacterium]NBZ99343.1 DNA-binding response regulator [Betaproteobacteria bacterium]NDB43582.1 DNA-binding response regulator [Betaproteobacteria bacterium]NDD00617.1 DNA-binding response regulator [Betaproteobacteria bacterium]NDD23917.1 DNA-binding response regulator [Betaproteobacteria bacterium]